MKAFEQEMIERFEDELFERAKSISPLVCRVLGEEQLRLTIRSMMHRAEGWGFTNRGPVRLCIELMLLLGSAFDTDPQYPELGAALKAPEDQMARAESMYQSYVEYLETVPGSSTRRALGDLSSLAQQAITWPASQVGRWLVLGIKQIFPEKAAYIGDTGLEVLIRESTTKAEECGVSEARHIALLFVLMLAFGHGCTSDPLYPWIGDTLRDARIPAASARAEQLERKARVWLDRVLAGYDQRQRA